MAQALLRLLAAHGGCPGRRDPDRRRHGLTQPTICHHLKIVVDAGIFSRDKRGVWVHNALVHGVLNALAAVLSTAS